jgi:Flp pilus assembly pilin Flp
MMNLLHSFIRDERGEDLIEYGLLAAFVAGVCLAVISNSAGLRGALLSAFEKARVALTTV